MTEAQLQIRVAQYLRYYYPDVLFHSDYGAGVKLTKAQAAVQKKQNGGQRAWPDMFIAHAAPNEFDKYHGLFLELKKDGTRIKKRDGDWASPHIAEQAEVLERLRQEGYMAEFVVGFEEAKELINVYLGGF